MSWLERNAHKRIDLQRVLAGAKSVITLAVSYDVQGPRSKVQGHAAAGVIARYAQFTDYHDVLAASLKSLTSFRERTRRRGHAFALVCGHRGRCSNAISRSAPDLGFVGKHTNLISRKLGNWIFLSEIITTLELEPDAPEKNHCGNCTRCITACPTNAITAPFNVDARRCISYLTIELKGSIPVELRRSSAIAFTAATIVSPFVRGTSSRAKAR